jgi:steroid delta-isomerase-like uncharacterized protein
MSLIAAENKRIFSAYINDVYNAHAAERVRDYLTSDVKWHAAQLGTMEGIENVVETLTGFFVAAPDFQVIEHASLAEGDLVAARITKQATHQDDFLGVPATGRLLRWDTIAVCRFADGRIAEDWSIDDFLAILQEMGAYTPPWSTTTP